MRKFLPYALWILLSVKVYAQIEVLHVPLQAPIDARSSRYLRLALNRAEELSSDVVILELDTYGGTVEDADKMRHLLLDFKQPVYAFINKNAASAGALISIACDSIYMSSGASIGAATVVVGGTGEKAPDKYQSYMRSTMRTTAEANHRDPKIAEAMVDPDVDIDSLAPVGKVLTLSTKEAIMLNFCEAEVQSIDALLARNFPTQTYQITRFELSAVEKIIAFFINPVLSSVLILVIIWGIYSEVQTPGVGFPGLAALIAAILYLTPYYLEGLAAYWEIALLLLGVGFLILELLAFPGFGIIGIIGAICAFCALVLVMVDNVVFDFSFVPEKALLEALGALLFALLGGFALLLTGMLRLPQSPLLRHIALLDTMDVQSGYRVHSTKEDFRKSVLNKEGVAYTILRPSGKVLVEGKIYEATSHRGEYIAKDTPIRIVSEEGRELRIEKVV